jgi:hypothetical protein
LKSRDKLERNYGQHVNHKFHLYLEKKKKKKKANEEREQLIHSHLDTGKKKRKKDKRRSRRLAAYGAIVQEIAKEEAEMLEGRRPKKNICVFLKDSYS